MAIVRVALTFDATLHEYRVNGLVVPSVTQVLERVGIIDYSYIPGQTRGMALARGSAVHAWTAYDDLNGGAVELLESQGDDKSMEVACYVRTWRKFRREMEFTPSLVEHRGYHSVFGYSGTLDRSGWFGSNGSGAVSLGDLKTNHAPWWTRLQTAAYAAFFPEPARLRRFNVELHPNEDYRYTEYQCEQFFGDFDDFLAALRVARLLEEA